MKGGKFLLLAWLAGLQVAVAAEIQWVSPADDGQPRIHLYLFWSQTCPHCLQARPQVQALVADQPWVVLHDLALDRADNLERYVTMARALGEEAQAVPALLYCGRMEVGWDSHPGHAERLLQSLRACRDRAQASAGSPLRAAPGDRVDLAAARTQTLELPLIGRIEPGRLSLPLLTVLIAGMDAFNPCAFFVLLFLLSLLVHQRSRKRMLAIGLVFVAISGLMYFAFMAAWLGVFLIVGSLPWITAAAGLIALMIALLNIKDFFAFGRGVSLSIPDAGRSDLFQRARAILNADSLSATLAATVLLAVAANFYELLCTAGFPLVYTRLLSLQVQDVLVQHVWLALYNLIYVLPLLAIVLLFVRTMGARKLGEREGRLLKLLSGLMMLGLGGLLVLAPARLDDPLMAPGLMLGAVGLTALAARCSRRP